MRSNIFDVMVGLLVIVILGLTGCGADSGTKTSPSVPKGVTATAGNGQVVLNWERVDSATSYIIYVSSIPGVTENSAELTGELIVDPHSDINLVFIDDYVSNGATYYFVMKAVNSVGESLLSTEVSATPAANLPAPAAPSVVMATYENGHIRLSWSKVIGAASYNVYYATTAGVTKATSTKLVGWHARTTGLNFTSQNSILISGIPYFFIVTAQNANGESIASHEVSATLF